MGGLYYRFEKSWRGPFIKYVVIQLSDKQCHIDLKIQHVDTTLFMTINKS